jgi:hypothetical protein
VIFVTLTRPKGDKITIRADHILEMGVFTEKDRESGEPTGTIGTWLLRQHIGWTPVMEDQDTVLAAIAAAKAGAN